MSEGAEPARFGLEGQDFAAGGQTITGALYLPQGDGWYPAVVLVGSPSDAAASGPWVAKLLGLGCAVLSFEAEGDGLAEAARAAADSLLMRPDINPELIGLLGTGTGAWAAARAARAPETAFVIFIAGEGAPGDIEKLGLADVHCPVLALAEGDAAAGLAQAMAHNENFGLRGWRMRELADGAWAEIEPWLRAVIRRGGA